MKLQPDVASARCWALFWYPQKQTRLGELGFQLVEFER